MNPSTIQLQINGTERCFPAVFTIAELLSELGIAPRGIAVEVNEQIVPRGDHAQRQLQSGDRVEIVSLVGGG